MTDYHWDGVNCISNSRAFTSATKPTNTDWNTVGSYTQTWTGSAWSPVDSTTTYNETESTPECRYKCAADYHWDGSVCASNSRTFTCNAKPANSEWNIVASYSQTWTGSAWTPADSTPTYDTTPSSTECRFQCLTNYTWNGTACEADTQPGTCTGLPADAEWNTVSSITQTWNGSAWAPSTAGAYNATPSTTECRFKCSGGNSWNGSACVAAFCGDGIAGNSTIPAFTEGFEGGVIPGYAGFDSYADSNWAISTADKHAGSYSIKSGDLWWADDYSSILMNKYSDGQICFWSKGTGMYSAEFEVSVDGSSKWYTSSNQSSWTQRCISVTAGYRMLEFRLTYSTDYSDGVWYVDDIRFYNATTEQCDGGANTCSGLGFDCGGAVSCGSDCTWQAGEADCHDDGGCSC
jgi:hypothetical protein